MTHRIVIVAAKRTPFGKFLGALTKHSAADLGVAAAHGALQSANIDPAAIDYVYLGNVLSAGQGQNVARQIALRAGIPQAVPAIAVNMMCASGIASVLSGAAAIRAGDASVVLCGGAESMSNAPYLLDRARSGYKLGDGKLIDSMLHDGLIDALHHVHMGVTVEALANEMNITRQAQDQFALTSQQRAAAAMEAGRFNDEIVPLKELDRDEHPRGDTTLEKLSSLKGVFPPTANQPGGTVTAGNASGINDGAAILIICSEKSALEKGWKPLAAITGWATVGCDPMRMGLGPVHATRELCNSHNLKVEDFDAIELNEAFAAQSLACVRELNLDPARVNPDGGAIAIGHPIGATGGRLLTHLAHQINRGRWTKALATLCIGGGMGAAVALEKC